LLSDLAETGNELPAGGYADSYVLLSSRQFDDCWSGRCPDC
jgi:hypothetical protein